MSLKRRKSPRLRGFDYKRSNAYFVTICTYERARLFGEVTDGIVRLSELGTLVQDMWRTVPQHHASAALDAFVVMPNHFHGIIWLTDDLTERSKSLSTVIGSFKSVVTRLGRRLLADTDVRIWQSRFHDHMIRDTASLQRIRAYVKSNALNWAEDRFYTE